jgi:HSP20 family protein
MMTLLEKRPVGEIDVFDRRLRRMFGGLGLLPTLTPAADIYEADDEFLVELEVPGFDEKELEIEVSDHTLTVKGKRTEEKEKTEKTLRLQERLDASFARSFVLPTEADAEHLSAIYGKGVLTLHVPKAMQAKPRKIEITAN